MRIRAKQDRLQRAIAESLEARRLLSAWAAHVNMELVRVTKDNLGTWARQLRDWGFTDVDPKYLALAK